MNEIKQSVQNPEKDTSRSVFWGTIALDVIAMLVFGYFLAFMLRLEKTPIIYLGMAVFLATFLAALSSLILTVRGKQKLGAEISLYALSGLGITMIAIFQGRTLTASFSIFTISIITILYLLPRQSRRWYFSVAVLSVIAMWVFEWIDPSWRISLGAANVGPAAVIVFAAILVAVVSRQAWGRSMRNKLLVAIIGTTLVTATALAVYVYVSANSILRRGLEGELSQHADGIAVSIGNLLDAQIDTMKTLSLNEILQLTVEEINNTYTGDASTIQTTLEARDEQWRSADAADNDNDPLVQEYLNNQAALELKEFQKTFPSNVEVFITDVYGGQAGTTNRTSDYYQADEDWWQAAYNNGNGAVYISKPEFDESANALAVLIAMPIRNRETGVIEGILRTTFSASALNTILSEQIGATGGTDLFVPGEVVSHFHEGQYTQVPPEEYTALQAVANQGMVEMLYEDSPSVIIQTPVKSFEGYQVIDNLGWVVLFHQQQDEALAPINAQTRGTLVVIGIVLALAVVAALGLSLFLVRPISQLTQTAEEVAAGNLNSRANITSSDEIGILASTFNTMTSRLQGTLQSLEERVAARTRNLELAAEVGRSVSQVRSLEFMLRDACELILKEFNLYYVQVYLTDPAQRNLVLEAGTGDVGVQLLGRGHNLPLDTGSINGRAAVEKHSVVISDTAQSTTFRKNPLLPETRGEMAVPLIVADQVVGVLDMQSSAPGVLTDEVLPAFEALAGQMAVAVQNANLVAETEAARAEVEAQARRLVRKGWDEHLDAIHKPEQLGYVFAQNSVTPLTDVDEAQLPENGKAISAPIAVTGESLGSLVVELDDEARAGQMGELVNIVARQVAQQVENLRLLESAERYRYEAEQAAQRQTAEGWKKYIESRPSNLGFMYDSDEVKPLTNDLEKPALTLPIRIGDVTVGKFSSAVQDEQSLDIAKAVMERLSTHIENLRLFEESRLGQVELDKRAKQLAAVAEISTASSQELEVDKLLETVVHLTQRQFDLYHAHIFVFNEESQALDIVACGWEEGSQHEGTHETNSIPLDQEQSLVARAARTGRAVIVNDVKGESGWLPNPLLPNTASEMAVPLIVGDRVLGVLDVQSDRTNSFTDEDANIQTTLASQVATAMQNARSFTQAQKQAEREAMLNVINQKIQSATSVEAVLQIAARELGTALGAPMTVAQLSMKNGNTSS